MPRKLAVLAGRGPLPKEVIGAARGAGREVFVLAFEGETDPALVVGIPHKWLPLGAIGRAVQALHEAGAEDVVMDIGSGCGFVGRTIAPRVKALHCVDFSPDFLGYCSRELSEFDNVACHLIEYADFSPVAEAGINKVYSTAVWIHYNYYDLNHYLAGLAEVMAPGGEIYFDYADPEGIADGDGRIFNEHYTHYRYNRSAIANLVQYNGESAIRTALRTNGFRMKARWQTDAECFSILARLAGC